jgi:hypothetical protein
MRSSGPHVATVPPDTRLRVWMRVPPPQLSEHAPQFVHALNTHVFAHAGVTVHACD